jgi:hypothetical protein
LGQTLCFAIRTQVLTERPLKLAFHIGKAACLLRCSPQTYKYYLG